MALESLVRNPSHKPDPLQFILDGSLSGWEGLRKAEEGPAHATLNAPSRKNHEKRAYCGLSQLPTLTHVNILRFHRRFSDPLFRGIHFRSATSAPFSLLISVFHAILLWFTWLIRLAFCSKLPFQSI